MFKSGITIIIILFIGCSESNFEKNQQIKRKTSFTFQGKKYSILILDSQNKEPYISAKKSLIKTLNNHGLIISKNLKIRNYSIGNDINRGMNILKRLELKKFDVIFVNGTVAASSAKKLYFGYSDINFVFACVTDPIGLGLIKSFETNPQNNFTGVSYPVLVNSRLKFITTLFPKTKNIGYIYSKMPQSISYLKWLKQIINKNYRGIKLHLRKVPFIKGENGTKKMAYLSKKYFFELNNKVDLFLTPNDQMGISEIFIKTAGKAAKKPVIGLSKRGVVKNWGAIASIYPSHQSMGEQAAIMIMKLLSGISIKEIKPEWPKKSGFAFNLKLAKKYKVNIPVEFIELSAGNIVK